MWRRLEIWFLRLQDQGELEELMVSLLGGSGKPDPKMCFNFHPKRPLNFEGSLEHIHIQLFSIQNVHLCRSQSSCTL